MSGHCRGTEFWDGLLRECIPCHMVCQEAQARTQCTDFCESYRCRATTGHFYDQLLRECLSCAQVCGTHPPECDSQCQTQSPAVTTVGDLVPPAVETAVLGWPSRGSPVLVVSLLSLCVALLACLLCFGLLLLQRRYMATRGQQRAQHPQQQQQSNQKGQDVEGQKWHSATETCVHCFPVSGEATPITDRSAELQNPTPDGPLLQQENCCHGNGVSRRQQSESPFHIICSPAQNSL